MGKKTPADYRRKIIKAIQNSASRGGLIEELIDLMLKDDPSLDVAELRKEMDGYYHVESDITDADFAGILDA